MGEVWNRMWDQVARAYPGKPPAWLECDRRGCTFYSQWITYRQAFRVFHNGTMVDCINAAEVEAFREREHGKDSQQRMAEQPASGG